MALGALTAGTYELGGRLSALDSRPLPIYQIAAEYESESNYQRDEDGTKAHESP
jgi:hypothetical protein